MDKKIDKEIKKLIENLEKGDKIQLELDRKNNCLKIWNLKLSKIEIKEVQDENRKNRQSVQGKAQNRLLLAW